MNHKRNNLLSGSYVPLTRVPEPRNECVSIILSALFRDGCLRNTIVKRERAGTHHSAPRARRAGRSPDSTTVLQAQRSRSSPASHLISSRDVRMTRAARPVARSMFSDIDVRLLEWKGASTAARVKGAGREVFMSSVQLCCESVMTGSSFFWPKKAPLRTPQIEGR